MTRPENVASDVGAVVAADAGAAIRARRLTRLFGPIPALEGVDLEVPRGGCVAILGLNGAGKSTLLRLCATLLRPSGGGLAILGGDAGADPQALRRRIGYLSHRTFLHDHLTGFENLQFYARLYGLTAPREAARGGLARAGLADRGDDLVGTYSRGMQQRLAIARALLHRPDLILLDEPFTGLDRDAAGRLERLLREEKHAGRTILLATHDLGPVVRLADRVVILAAGRIAADRPAAGLDAAGLDALLAERSAAPGGDPVP
ncbi:MAG: ABC transporter ATP-binding protein [Candidatus Polarisedimenticolia bacterium]